MNINKLFLSVTIILAFVGIEPYVASGQLIRVVSPKQWQGSEYQKILFSNDQLIAMSDRQVDTWHTDEQKPTTHISQKDRYGYSIISNSMRSVANHIELLESNRDGELFIRKFGETGEEADSNLVPLPSGFNRRGPVCWSEEGGQLALAGHSKEESFVIVLDTETTKELARVETKVKAMTFSKDGKSLLVATDGNQDAIRLLDVSTGKTLASTKGFASRIKHIAITPDGQTVISTGRFGGKDGITFWNSNTLHSNPADHVTCEELGLGSRSSEFDGDESEIAIWPDGKLMAVASERAIHILDIESRTPICELRGMRGAEKLCVSTDGNLLASYDGDKGIALWRWKDALQEVEPVRTVQSHRHGDYRPLVKFSPDGKTLAFTCAAENQYEDVGGGELAVVATSAADVAASGSFADGNKAGAIILLIDPSTGNPIGKLSTIAHQGLQLKKGDSESLQSTRNFFTKIEFAPDGRHLLATNEGGYNWLMSWSLATNQLDQLVRLPRDAYDIDFSPSGDELVVSTKYASLKINADSNRWSFGEVYGNDYASSNAFTTDGKYFLRGLKQYERESNASVFEASLSNGKYFQSLVVSKDGRFAYAFNDVNVIRWNLDEAKIEFPFAFHTDSNGGVSTKDLALSPSGNTLATATTDHKIRLWDTNSGQLFVTLTGHQAQVNSIDFSPDGKMLASAGSDGTTRFWNVESFVNADSSTPIPNQVQLPANRKYLTENGAFVKVIFDRPATSAEFKSAIAEALKQVDNTEK